MEKKIFKTLVKDNHVKFGRNSYIRGRISGIQYVVCDKDTYANKSIDGGIIQTCKCTPEQYEQFTEIVDKMYPGLCIFNYEESK